MYYLHENAKKTFVLILSFLQRCLASEGIRGYPNIRQWEPATRLCRIKAWQGNMLFFLWCYLTMSLIQKAFKRLHYPVDVIAQCVRWYLAYSLSLRNLEEIMAERGVIVDHATLHRWLTRVVPLLDKAFRRYKRRPGGRWRMDETYIRVKCSDAQWWSPRRAINTPFQTTLRENEIPFQTTLSENQTTLADSEPHYWLAQWERPRNFTTFVDIRNWPVSYSL